MEFQIEPVIFEHFPAMRLAVVIAEGIDNSVGRPAVTDLWRQSWQEAGPAGAAYGNAQSHPRVRPWRERLRAAGAPPKEFPSSIEAMLRRAMKGGEPFAINPLVDFYNSISLRFTVPAGGFDLDQIAGPLHLRLSRAGDTFTAMDSAEVLAIPPGEVAYADGSAILTRHFVWRQSRAALVTPATRTAFLVSEVLGDVEPGGAEAVRDAFDEGVRTHFGATTRCFILDEHCLSIAW
jgi:DNA/RNA-binding domain of Phe-tRNA-synthetase-like protein